MAIKLTFSKNEKILLLVTIILSFFYGTYNFVYKPLKEDTESLESEIFVTEQHLRKNLQLVHDSETIEKEYKNIFDHFRQKESDEAIMSSMLSQIDSITNEVSVRIADIKPQKVKKIDFYNHFSVSLTLEGVLSDIMRFISILQNPPYSYYIDDFQIRRKSANNEELRCLVVFSRILIPSQ